jgi:hypothetical protein
VIEAAYTLSKTPNNNTFEKRVKKCLKLLRGKCMRGMSAPGMYAGSNRPAPQCRKLVNMG